MSCKWVWACFSMGWYNKHPTSYVSICQHPGCKCWPAISSSWFAEKILVSYGPLLNDSLWRPCLSPKCSHIGNVTHLLCLTTSLCFPHKEATVWFDAIVSARLYLMLPVVSLGTSNEVPLGSSRWWRSGAAGVGRGRWARLWRDSFRKSEELLMRAIRTVLSATGHIMCGFGALENVVILTDVCKKHTGFWRLRMKTECNYLMKTF